MTVVVAAVIEREGLVLIGQRLPGGAHPLEWEFPGGKVEPEEDPRAALRRELKEELDIEAEIGGEIARYQYRYAGRPAIQLIFFRVETFRGAPRNMQFERIVWEDPKKLVEYDFLEGDVEFVRRLTGGDR